MWVYHCLPFSVPLLTHSSSVSLFLSSTYPHGGLSPSPSSFHLPPAALPTYEALARGELHNSWLCYTPTASLGPLPEGQPPPNPPCATTFYASTISTSSSSSSFSSMPGSTLVACIVRHHVQRVCACLPNRTMHTKGRTHMHVSRIKLALRYTHTHTHTRAYI